MKTLYTFIFLLLLCQWANAQDTILKTDQTEVSAKVVEITTDEVKFKYFNRLDGPTYTLKKSEVFVVIYKDGTREKFGPANATLTSSDYTETPVSQPVKPSSSPVTSSYSTPSVTESKRSGFTYGLNYTTPSLAFGQAHGMGLGWGYYFLGRGRKGGGLIDTDVLYLFNNVSTQYGLISLNGMVRASETSKFYLGGGVGLGSVSVDIETYDYALRRTTTKREGALGFGGKAFMGYGLFRVSIIMPSFEGIQGGGLVTIGFSTNPFTK